MTNFQSFKDLQAFIKENYGINYNAWKGINYFSEQKTLILVSVDNVKYYRDRLDKYPIKYTAEGRIGDQNINGYRDKKQYGNYHLFLNKDIKHIYLCRKVRKGFYSWYGEFKVCDFDEKEHPDIKGENRRIYRAYLKYV